MRWNCLDKDGQVICIVTAEDAADAMRQGRNISKEVVEVEEKEEYHHEHEVR